MAKRRHRSVIVTPKDRQMAKGIAEGKSYREAMLEAGYGENTANKGKLGLTAGAKIALFEELKKRGMSLEQVGAEYKSMDRLENLIAGRLVSSVIEGDDKGVAAAKALGTMTRAGTAMRQDVNTGIMIIQMPESLATKPDPMQLEATEVLDLGKPKLLGS